MSTTANRYNTMPRLVIQPLYTISRLFVHIAINLLSYEYDAISGQFIHSFIIGTPAFKCNLGYKVRPQKI